MTTRREAGAVSSTGTAIITGSGRRVGRAIASRLSELGYSVCIHYWRSSEESEALAADLQTRGGEAVTVRADLATGEPAVDAILSASQTLAPPTLLINNASVFNPQRLPEVTAEEFDQVMATNLRAPLLLSRNFAALSSATQIINITDWRGVHPVPGHLTYTLSKVGLTALTQILALELAPRIRVNAIAPGALLPASHGQAEDLELACRNPLQRAGGTAAVVRGVEYLLGADFVTGEVLRVTGGEELAIQKGHGTVGL